MDSFELVPDWKFLHRAEALIEIERWREAIHELHQYLRYSPDGYRGLCLMAQCHYQLDENEETLKWAKRAIEIDPRDEWAFRLQACAYRKMGKKSESLAAAEEAVRLSPEETFALHMLALAQIDLDKLDEAERTSLELRQLAPETRYGHSALGHIAMNRENWVEAETHFRKMLEIEPTSFDGMNNLGWVLLQQAKRGTGISLKRGAQRAEAIECFKRAVQIDPTEELARINLKAAENTDVTTDASAQYDDGGGNSWFRWWHWLILVAVLQIFLRLPTNLSKITAIFATFSPSADGIFNLFISLYFAATLAALVIVWIMQRGKTTELSLSESPAAETTSAKWTKAKIIAFVLPLAASALFFISDGRRFAGELSVFVIIALWFYLIRAAYSFYLFILETRTK